MTHSLLLPPSATGKSDKLKLRTYLDWGNEDTTETVHATLRSFHKRSKLYKHAMIALGKVDPMGMYTEGDPELESMASAINSLCEIDHNRAHEQRLQIMAVSKALCLKQNATPFCETVVEAVRKSIAVVEGLL